MAKKGRRPPPGSGGTPPGGAPRQGRSPMGGMPDMQQLMQQAAQMQAEVQRRQAELAEATFEGTAGGGVVTAVVRGSGELISVTIDPAVLDPEDPEMVGDLVVAAVNQALKGIQDAAAETMPALPDLGDLGDLGGLLG